jgi:serine/threonine-protein kinase
MVLTPDGTVVSRTYELIEELGRGAAGTVWRGRATATGREYAIKILHEDSRAPKAIARFLQERDILLRLRHQNLVAVHDLLTTADGRLALVLDLVTGGTLRELLRQRGTMPPAAAADLLGQVADGLAVAHASGVVHRDLKPDNILLAPTLDGGVRARLTDFGIARLLDGSGMTTSGAVLGTPNYMAPEVIEGSKATPAADVYALGIIQYELLAGRPPFDEEGCDTAILVRHTRAAARPPAGMPPRVWALIEACLHRDPAQRPAAETLRTTLRRLAAETAGIAALPPLPRGQGRQTFRLAENDEVEGRKATPERRRITPRPVKAPVQAPAPARKPRHTTTALVAIAVLMLLAVGLAGLRPAADENAARTAPPAPGPNPGDAPGAGGPAGSGADPSAGPARPDGNADGSAAPAPAGSQVSAGPSGTARPVAPIGEAPEDYGQWQCTEELWPIGHPMVGQACFALGTSVRVKGVFSGISGVKANIEVAVENVDTGSTASGPFRCPDRRFTDTTPKHTCGPYTVSLPPGRYRVVGRWVYADVDAITPPGSVVGSPFDW